MQGREAPPLIKGIDVSHGDEWVVVRWRQRFAEPCEVIVTKSEQGHADDLGELFVDDAVQRAVYYDTGTQCQDQDVIPGVEYYYTVFAQAPDGSWHRQGHERAKVRRGPGEGTMAKFHEDGTLLAKLDTLRIGMFSGGGFSMGGT